MESRWCNSWRRRKSTGGVEQCETIGMTNANDLIENNEFIEDMARYSSGVLTEAQVKRKYRRFDDDIWEKLGSDDQLVDAIDARKLERIRDGRTKRELAQLHVVEAPRTLNDIMLSPAVSPRTKIDAAKTLDGLAATGPEAVQPVDRFIIRIDLSAGTGDADQILTFNKSIPVTPDDDDVDTAPILPAIAAKPKMDGGCGEPI
jgi:hypothetical protein